MTAEEFIKAAEDCFPEISSEQKGRFLMLEPLYNDWNAKINVISRKDIGSLIGDM